MPDYLLQLDRRWFYLVNHTLTNPVFDAVMPWFRNPLFWIPLYIFIIAFSIWRYRAKGIWLIVSLLLTVGTADFVSASIIKKMAQRNRPCRDVALTATVISRVPCGTGYSFPSTHASDHFAMSVFLSLVYVRKWRWVWLWALLWAALVCFAQVYVGVHYPIDVLSGAAFGALTGAVYALLFKKFQPDF